MKKYFYLQLKKVFRFFPYLLAVTLILLVGTAAILWGMLSANSEKSENIKVNIGVSGDINDPLIKLGLDTFRSFDETKYSIELLEYTEPKAKAALKKGEIAAYIVVPPGFVEKALYGEIDPVRFVTTTEAGDIITLFKNEILQIITDILVSSQKGTYGMGDALDDQGYPELSGEHINNISWQYLDLSLNRTALVEAEEIGVENHLSTTGYYICSILIFFLMLMGLPFVYLYCKGDHSLSALLHAKGVSGFSQLLSEFMAIFLALAALVTALMGTVALGGKFVDLSAVVNTVKEGNACPFLTLLPALVLLSGFNLMIFELSKTVISGLLTHFFVTISLCYVSGCFYPIYAFPKAVQKFASALPICVIREQLAPFFTGKQGSNQTLFVLAYAVLFFGIALVAKRLKLLRHGG